MEAIIGKAQAAVTVRQIPSFHAGADQAEVAMKLL
jgi:hypothetical protein